MPVPVFASIGIQNIIQGSAWEFDIAVEHIPTSVRVRGELYGFYYDFNRLSGANRIRIKIDLAEDLLTNKHWDIEAGNDDGTAELEVTYNVVKGAPVVTVASIKLPIGVDIEERIPITNTPGGLEVSGLLTRLRYNNVEQGVDLTGNIPDDLRLTTDSGELDFLDSSESIGTVSFTLHDAPSAVRNLRSSSNFLGTVVLNFDAPTDTGGFPISYYQWKEDIDEDWTTSNALTTIQISSVTAGDHTYLVRAVNTNEIYGQSAQVTETVSHGIPPTITRGFGPTTYDPGDRVIILFSVTGTPTPTVTVTGLPSGLSWSGDRISGTISSSASVGSYSVTLTATNSAGTATLTFTLRVQQSIVAPSAVTSLFVSHGGGFIFASWSAPSNASGSITYSYSWLVNGVSVSTGTTTSTAVSVLNTIVQSFPSSVTFSVRPSNSAGTGPTTSRSITLI